MAFAWVPKIKLTEDTDTEDPRTAARGRSLVSLDCMSMLSGFCTL